MRIYINKKNKLIIAPDYFEKFGGSPNNTIQILDSSITQKISKEVEEAVKAVIDKWQPFFESIDLSSLFEEQERQIRGTFDVNEALTKKIEENFNE